MTYQKSDIETLTNQKSDIILLTNQKSDLTTLANHSSPGGQLLQLLLVLDHLLQEAKHGGGDDLDYNDIGWKELATY